MRRTFKGYYASSSVRRKQHGLIGVVIASVFMVACNAVPTKQGLLNSVQVASNGVKSGVKGSVSFIKDKTPGTSVKKPDGTIRIVSKYPLNQVPHTLLKKPVAEGKLTSGHGYRFSPTGVPIPKKHKGVDYSAPTGTPVYAAGNGTIVKRYKSKSYGNYISIEHENSFITAYAHMQAFADGLSIGSVVSKGQQIGSVGSTGRSSGPHLHFELIHGSTFIDPIFKYVPEPEQIAAE